jgi:hypothetical protein
MFQILIDLSTDPLMMYLQSAEIHTLVTESKMFFLIYFSKGKYLLN